MEHLIAKSRLRSQQPKTQKGSQYLSPFDTEKHSMKDLEALQVCHSLKIMSCCNYVNPETFEQKSHHVSYEKKIKINDSQQ